MTTIQSHATNNLQCKFLWGAYQLIGEAIGWWENKKVIRCNLGSIVEFLRKIWLPQLFIAVKWTNFQDLRQRDLFINEYWENFTWLFKYIPQFQEDEKYQIGKLITGINNQIGGLVDVLTPTTMGEAYEKVVRQNKKIKKDDSIIDRN